MRHIHTENFQGIGNLLGKRLEVGVSPVCLKNSKEVSMVGAESEMDMKNKRQVLGPNISSNLKAF